MSGRYPASGGGGAAIAMAYAGNPLDRADAVRSDPDRLAALRAGPGLLLRLTALVPPLDGAGRLAWAPLAEASPEAELVLLGIGADGRGRFAEVPADEGGSTSPFDPKTRAAVEALPADELAIYALARSMVNWHARHRFCARCGQASRLTKAGWQRTCANPACRAEHFPRVDPVTIMLVEHEDRLLLGRQPRFPPRRWSALAGFVEPGETVEEAVAREVHEEAGVSVHSVRYVMSQPWPFPSSLMLGCHALAASPALTVDHSELEDARWFTRAEVTAALAGARDAAFLPPPPSAVARRLLEWWLDTAPGATRDEATCKTAVT